ncbi:hypothetical protein ACLQ26_10500 [Micromonospora sp. DT43]|uniref:hypothetical protein n=1 Tax=Micromonospora sp. DT43 TaxID=3393440 RepID=UPI003CF3CDDD
MASETDDLRQVVLDPKLSAKVTDLISFTSLLQQCVLDSSYRISDDWIRSIRLTALGESVVSGLTEKYKNIKPNDARLTTFLRIGASDGLFISLATDLDGLRKTLGEEIRRGRILFPYVFGRDLHDLAAEIAPKKTTLSLSETLTVLRKLPVGVFQSGWTTVGPYGCQLSPFPRQMRPLRKVPGYLCSDVTCHKVHNISLQTGATSIRRAGEKMEQYVSTRFYHPVNDHRRLVTEAQFKTLASSITDTSSNLFDLLSDALSLNEVRAVVDLLLRRNFRSNGGHGHLSKSLGLVIGDPTQFVGSIGRAECIQIMLLNSDADVVAAVDECIRAGAIKVKDYEVRKSRLNRWGPPLQAELGPLGVRFVIGQSGDYTARQLMRLIHTIYYETDGLDPADLAYAIQHSPTRHSSELIGMAVQKKDPRVLLQSLVLPVRRAAAKASSFLGIANFESMPSEEFLERMCWKLGMPSPIIFSELPRVSSYEEEFRRACTSGHSNDELKAIGSKLFTAIEDCVQRSLVYITWAMTSDHYMNQQGFEYDPEMSTEVISFIEERVPASDESFALRTDKRNTLQPLAASFARLAKALSRLDESDHQRPEEQIPAAAKAFPQPFAWKSQIPFLNLSANSRESILTSLQRLSRILQNPVLIGLRNSCNHGNNELPAVAKIIEVLDLVRDWRIELWSAGFFPRVYSLTSVVRDALGRSARTYSDNTSHITLLSPEWAVSPRLPTSRARIAVIPCAEIETSGPIRFSVKSRPGEDPYWVGYPLRWITTTDYDGESLTGDSEIDLNMNAAS